MDILSDEEVWNRLHHALAAIGEARGETGFGRNTLDTARTALTALQMAILHHTDNIRPTPLEGFQTLTVLLPPEAIADIDKFILNFPRRMTTQEAVAFLLGEALTRRKQRWGWPP